MVLYDSLGLLSNALWAVNDKNVIMDIQGYQSSKPTQIYP